MPNLVKYSTTNVANSLRKNNVAIACNSVDYGPTSSTGFWNGITPPQSGYTIYTVPSNANSPSIVVANNENELIYWAEALGGSNITTESGALAYISTLNNTVAFNKNIENIITESLSYYINPSFTPSFPRQGTNLFDLSGTGNATNGNKTGTLTNGVSYNSSNGGVLSFDGTDDQIKFDQGTNTYDPILLSGPWTASFWVKTATDGGLFSHWSGGPVNLALAISSGKMNFYYYDGQWNDGTSTGAVVSTNLWVFLTWVRPVSSTDPVKMYINGVLDYNLNPRISWGSYNMGNLGAWWSFNFFNGLMGPVMIHNKALSQSEILQNYYQSTLSTSNLTMNVDPAILGNNNTSTTITDLTTNKYVFNYEGTVSWSSDNGGSLRLNTGKIYRDSLGWYGNYTISFWMKMVGTISTTTYFYTESFRGDGGCARIYSYLNTNGTFTYNVWDNSSGGGVSTTSTTNVCDGAWHNITCVWSNGTYRTAGIYIFINGVQEGFSSMVGNDGSYASMHLGGVTGCLGNFSTNCYLGPILQYNNIALSNTEINNNFSAYSNRYR